MTTQTNPGALDGATLSSFQENYEAQPAHQLMQNVVTQHDVNDVALNRNIVAQAANSFSTVLDDWSVTNQARSGRCWMFAGLNLFRAETRGPAERETVRVQPELRDVLGQDGTGQLHTGGRDRDRRPAH